MSKYEPLGKFLLAQPVAHVPMTFGEIERVLGLPLPPVAATARTWWSNNPSNNVMTKVWLAAGFKTEQVDMERRRLVFRREGPRRFATAAAPAPNGNGTASVFGCLKGTITFPQPLDLTAPADPDWSGAAR